MWELEPSLPPFFLFLSPSSDIDILHPKAIFATSMDPRPPLNVICCPVKEELLTPEMFLVLSCVSDLPTGTRPLSRFHPFSELWQPTRPKIMLASTLSFLLSFFSPLLSTQILVSSHVNPHRPWIMNLRKGFSSAEIKVSALRFLFLPFLSLLPADPP